MSVAEINLEASVVRWQEIAFLFVVPAKGQAVGGADVLAQQNHEGMSELPLTFFCFFFLIHCHSVCHSK